MQLILFYSVFLILFYLLLGSKVSTTSGRTRIAVCISGQISRWMPETTVPYLLQANPNFEFTFFINLQFHLTNHSYVYSTDGHLAFRPTKFVEMSHMDVLRYVHQLYSIESQSSVASINFVPPRKLEEWERESFGGKKADRISQYADMQHVVLNFYQHQHSCHTQFSAYEKLHNVEFAYVLSTREDSYYLSAVNVSHLTAQLRKTGECDMIARNCIAWGGINVRWHLMTRNTSDYVLGRRFEFYRLLFKERRQSYNPEQFEATQLEYYGLKICELDPNIIPTLIARHVMNDEVCFLKPETIDHCVPLANNSFVSKKMCHRIDPHLRVKLEPS